MVAAMKCKQGTDPKSADALKSSIKLTGYLPKIVIPRIYEFLAFFRMPHPKRMTY